MSKRWHILLTILVGVASGFLGTYLSSGLVTRPGVASEAKASAPDSELRVEKTTQADSEAMAWIRAGRERQLAELEEKVSSLQGAASMEGTSIAADDELTKAQIAFAQMDPEIARKQTLDAWQAKLDSHNAESVDTAWSNATTALFEDDVSLLAEEQDFQLVKAQCKTNTCSATVEWPDYGAAVSSYGSLLHHMYKVGCNREVILPEPAQREAPYQATVLYDCSQVRAGGG